MDESRKPWGPEETPYEALGGEPGVRLLAETFYDRVEDTAPNLQAMLPADTTVSRQKLFEFLSGWAGGPQLYWEKHGHPRLRMRHAPFPINAQAATDWARCMDEALASLDVTDAVRVFMSTELSKAARSLINEAPPVREGLQIR